MVNELKIITMTRLALYDKHEGPADRIANDYFRHDYIYRNNFGTRLAVGFGGFIILGFYWLHIFVIGGMDIFALDYVRVATNSVFFLLALLAVYSLVGTVQGTRQYYLVQKRLAQYQAMVRQLERQEERERRSIEDYESHPPPRRRPHEVAMPPVYNPSSTQRIPQSHKKPPSQTQRPPAIEQTRAPRPRPEAHDHTRRIGHDNPAPIEHTRAPSRPIQPPETSPEDSAT